MHTHTRTRTALLTAMAHKRCTMWSHCTDGRVGFDGADGPVVPVGAVRAREPAGRGRPRVYSVAQRWLLKCVPRSFPQTRTICIPYARCCQTQARTHAKPLTHAHTRTHARAHARMHARTHTPTHPHPPTHPPAPTHSHTLARSLAGGAEGQRRRQPVRCAHRITRHADVQGVCARACGIGVCGVVLASCACVHARGTVVARSQRTDARAPRESAVCFRCRPSSTRRLPPSRGLRRSCTRTPCLAWPDCPTRRPSLSVCADAQPRPGVCRSAPPSPLAAGGATPTHRARARPPRPLSAAEHAARTRRGRGVRCRCRCGCDHE